MPLPYRLPGDSQTWAARLGPLAQGDHDGLRGIASPPQDGRDRPLSGAHAGQKRCDRRDTAGAGRPRDRGKVRYIGCANYAGYSLVESLWAADRLQTHRYESIQLQWSLVRRSAERELIPAAAAFGLGVLIWSPLSRGFLSGNTNAAERRRRISPRRRQRDFQAFDNEKNWNLLDVVGRIAEQHETTHSAVVARLASCSPQTSSILVGARTEAQLEDNLGALSIKLTSENLKELDEASRPDWDYPWDVIRDSEAGDAKLLS